MRVNKFCFISLTVLFSIETTKFVRKKKTVSSILLIFKEQQNAPHENETQSKLKMKTKMKYFIVLVFSGIQYGSCTI